MSQPWSCGVATLKIRELASKDITDITYKQHAVERLNERNLIISDVLYVLKNGFVYDEPTQSTRPNLYKYAVEGKSPNSNARTIKIIIIPDNRLHLIKIITVMWKDEFSSRAGNIIGVEDNE